jgi:hypothetical protein
MKTENNVPRDRIATGQHRIGSMNTKNAIFRYLRNGVSTTTLIGFIEPLHLLITS